MARHSLIICDLCGQPTDELAGKLSWIPNLPGIAPLNWNNYTHTAHIGVCCMDKLFELVKFQPRMTQTQYRNKRKKDAQKSTIRARKTSGVKNGS